MRHGKPVGLRGILVDITDRKQLEERALAAAFAGGHRLYQDLFERSNEGITIIADRVVRYCNPSLAALVGRTVDELVGTPFTDHIHPDELAKVAGFYKIRMEGGTPPSVYESALRHRDGHRIEVEINAGITPFEGRTADFVFIRDISESKWTEEVLRQSENLYRALFENSGTPMIFVEEDTTISLANREFEKLSGYSRTEVEGKMKWPQIVAEPGQLERMKEYHRLRRVDPASVPSSYEFTLARKKGDYREVAVTVVVMPGTKKSLASFLDVTERKRAEAELQRHRDSLEELVAIRSAELKVSEEKHRVLLESIGNPILALNSDLTVTYCNRAYADLVNMPKESLVGLRIEDLLPRFASGKTYRAYRLALETGQPQEVEGRMGRRWLHARVFPTPGGILSIAEDVTERKQAELLRSVLYEVSDSISSAESLDTFWPELHRSVGKLIPADNFFIALYDPQNQRVKFPYFVDEFDTDPGERLLGKGLTDEVLRTGKPLHLMRDDFGRSQTTERFDTIGTPCHSWIGIPLKIGDKTFGAVVVQSYSRDILFGDREQQAVNFICQRVASAIDGKRAEEQVRESEKRFRALFEQSNDAVIVHGIDGAIHDANEQACLMFGYRRQDFLSRNLAAIVPPGSRLMPRRAFMQVFRRGSARFESQFRTAGDVLMDIEVSSSLVDRERRLFQSILRDISERKRAESALRESEQRFRKLFQQSNDAVIVHDIRGKIIDVNPAACVLFGYDREAFSAKKVQDLPPPGEFPMPMRSLLHMMRKGSVRFDSRFMRSDGAVLEAEVSSSVVDRERRVFQSIVRDITERKRAESALRESEHSFRRLFEQSNDAILIHDIYGGITDANTRACEMLGYGRDQFAGLTVHGLQPSNEMLMAKYAFQKAITKGTVRFETRLSRSDGAVLEVDISSALVERERKLFQSIVRDVTTRKQAQRELKKAAEELARSNRELEQFAYVASHDLQEPLRMISSYLQLLERRYRDRLDADASEFIGYAVEGASRMRAMINDLLNYSRVTTKAQPLVPVAMDAVLRTALSNLTVAIEESGARITSDPLPEVQGDSGQLVQLLQNLVANAIKFRGNEPPRIQLSAGSVPEGWRFSVRDNGIGIEPQYAERIFLIFQRLHTREEYPGTGIGLAVCQKIVERHGGRIWVQSQAGEGSTFHFTLRPADDGSAAQDSKN